jgi:hypothetical protein
VGVSSLPASTSCDWQVAGHSGTSTESGTHALADYYRVILLISGASGGFAGAGTFALGTDIWGFTTAP